VKVLVTGSNGQVGARLCALLLERGHDVTGVSRGPKRGEGKHRHLAADLGDSAQVRAALETAAPELVLNPASMTEVDACEKEPAAAWAMNAQLPATLALQSLALGFHLVHVSTDYVFDGDRGNYGVDDVPNPRGVYAVTKHAGEQAVRWLSPRAAVARTAVVFGWPAAGRPNFGSWVFGSLREGKPLKLFEDQVVSPTHADSVALQVAELGERKLPGVWHTAGATAVTRFAFGQAVCARFGFSTALLTPTRLKDLNLASPRPLNSSLDVSKTAAGLTAKPLTLEAALEAFARSTQGAP
jgi:dTDP-4-dehydrorhamnose reductase